MTGTVNYVAPTAPNFRLTLKLESGDVELQWKHGQCIVDDPEIEKALDEILIKRPRIARDVKKVDKRAAEQVALAHKAAQGLDGIRGPVSAGAMSAMRGNAQAAVSDALHQMGADATASDAAAAVIVAEAKEAEGMANSTVDKPTVVAKSGPSLKL